jgi:hypothetical protein
MDPTEDDVVDFRLRTSRRLKERVTRYAHAHPARDAAGRERPLSLNTAAIVLLEAALDAASTPP